MLNTVDSIGQGELSYLEFYNCCYSSTGNIINSPLTLVKLILNFGWDKRVQYSYPYIEGSIQAHPLKYYLIS